MRWSGVPVRKCQCGEHCRAPVRLVRCTRSQARARRSVPALARCPAQVRAQRKLERRAWARTTGQSERILFPRTSAILSTEVLPHKTCHSVAPLAPNGTASQVPPAEPAEASAMYFLTSGSACYSVGAGKHDNALNSLATAHLPTEQSACCCLRARAGSICLTTSAGAAAAGLQRLTRCA